MSIARIMQQAAASAAASEGWNLANAVYNGSPIDWFYIGTQETNPQGIFFKDDGTKMYIVGSSGDDVNEYSLSTAWDISTASYVQNFSVSAQELSPTGLFFKDDGTKMYIVGSAGRDVNEYSLSTAWNISTASYVQNFSVSAEETNPLDIFFKPDGTKMYIVGSAGDEVNEYSLSTAWDISTASYVQNFSVVTQETTAQGIFFKPDGTRMYIIGSAGDDVNEYSLSTAWNISTASYVQNFSVVTEETSPTGLFFKPDGTKMYIMGNVNLTVIRYDLSTPWDISTALFTNPTSNFFSVQAQETSPTGLFFKPDGTKMYIVGIVSDSVYEYSLSTAWDISTASYVQNFSVSAEEGTPQDIFFKPDGTRMYIIGSTGDDVNEYSLSTAWDISTASYVGSVSVALWETLPYGLFFKPDGTRMYIVGSTGDDVTQFNLSTAWNIGAFGVGGTKSVATEDITPTGLFFKDDGTKMYIVGAENDSVYEYTLSTAWTVSTASYVQNFSVEKLDISPAGLFFKDDGKKMYIVGSGRDAIVSYNL